MMRTAILAAAMVGLLAWFGPSLDIDDNSTEVAVARMLEDAQREAAARDRFERAAQGLCGPQAAWEEISKGVVQCFTKRGKPVGRKTHIAQGAL